MAGSTAHGEELCGLLGGDGCEDGPGGGSQLSGSARLLANPGDLRVAPGPRAALS